MTSIHAGTNPRPSPPDEPASPPEASPTPPGGALAASRVPLAVALLVPALLLSIFGGIMLGSAVIPANETADYLWKALTGGSIQPEQVTRYQIIWQIRTPRVVLAAVVGAGLSAAGVVIQALARNALGDPYILGISSGASVGAVAVSVFGGLAVLGLYAVSVGAFAGALVATVVVWLVASGRGGPTPLRLVLTGVACSFGFQAVMSVMIYLAPTSEATSTVLFWTMGGFGAATWGSLPIVAALITAGIVGLRRFSPSLDVLALGDETAASLGINAVGVRRTLFGVTALMTGAMVAVSGTIGFVGLIVPHITRMIIGARHARVLVVAPLIGAVLMIWVDLFARVLAAPRELPLGVITAILGVPVFIWLMRRRQYSFGGGRGTQA